MTIVIWSGGNVAISNRYSAMEGSEGWGGGGGGGGMEGEMEGEDGGGRQ